MNQEAFNTLKEKLIEFPILRQPNQHKPFLLMTDASGFALGAILAQKEDGKEYVCCYASRLLKGAETHYGITEKECLAVVWAIKHFRIYLYGNKFEVITDHAALHWLMTINDPTGRLARWSIYLQAYNFEIIHRKGRIHSNVDALSRPVLMAQTNFEVMHGQEDEDSSLDIHEDEYLLYYLQYGKHKNGSSKKQVKRITRLQENYKLIGSKIYYRKNKEDEFNLIVPTKAERKEIITKAHILGHFQTQTTYDRLKQKYFWKNMINEIKEVINNCLICIRHQKQAQIHQKASALEINGIFERIGIDLVLGLPETEEGYKGILVVTEYLSKFPYAVPIKSKSAEEIAEKLWYYISIFGPPKEILSDQGTEFLNEIVGNLTRAIGIEHRITSPYHPQTNGLTERFNQTLIQSLKKHAEKDPQQWDKWLPYVLLAYRTRIHSSSGFSPFQLMFGREMNMFEDYQTIIDSPIEKRSKEIKQLIEETYPRTIDKS